MVPFLSPAWIDALAAAARDDAALAEATVGLSLVVEHHVTDTPSGTVSYHVRFADGTTTVAAGAADDATVRFTQDLATAVAIATGAESAQRAFMAGRLQVGGSMRALLDHGAALAALSDTFAAVRAETSFDLDPAATPT
jgi:nanoRNase/pAp phosphatase (c-di-AMP/oligoRNAs hydrolase)